MDSINHNYPKNTLQRHVTDFILSISETWVLETRFATAISVIAGFFGDSLKEKKKACEVFLLFNFFII